MPAINGVAMLVQTIALEPGDGGIRAIYVIRNPEKLRSLKP